MLTTAEEDRLEEDLPLVQSIPYGDGEYEYELAPYWFGADHVANDADVSPDYPAIVFQWDSQGNEVNERRSIGDFSDLDERPGETVVEEIQETGYDDQLSVTVAVEATHDENGVPPNVRGPQLARAIWRYLRFEVDLQSEGANGERPMTIDVQDPPTPVRVDRTLRYEWSVAVSYVDEHAVEVDAVADADYDVDIE
jgi:hypothetical protein